MLLINIFASVYSDPLLLLLGILLIALSTGLIILAIKYRKLRQIIRAYEKKHEIPEKSVESGVRREEEVIISEIPIQMERVIALKPPEPIIIHSIPPDVNSIANEIIRWDDNYRFRGALADHLFNSMSEGAVRELLKVSRKESLKKLRFGEFDKKMLIRVLNYYKQNNPGTLIKIANQKLPTYLQNAIKSFIRGSKETEFLELITSLRHIGIKSLIIISVLKEFGAWPRYIIGLTPLGHKLLQTPPLSSELLITAKHAVYIETRQGEKILLREIAKPGTQILVLIEMIDTSKLSKAIKKIDELSQVIVEKNIEDPEFIHCIEDIFKE